MRTGDGRQVSSGVELKLDVQLNIAPKLGGIKSRGL